MFNYGGAAIHPVTAIDILDIAHRAYCRAVDMAANDTIQAAILDRVNDGIFKVKNE